MSEWGSTGCSDMRNGIRSMINDRRTSSHIHSRDHLCSTSKSGSRFSPEWSQDIHEKSSDLSVSSS